MESGGEATPLLLGSGATPARIHPIFLRWAPFAVGGAGLTALIVGTLVGILALPTQAPQPVEQIAVNFGADATSTLVISWASFSARADAGVRWGLSPSSLTGFAVAASRTYVEPTDPTYTSPVLYNATITDLAPNTRVFYRVGNSAVLNVSTSVAVGAPIHIALLGDLGTTGNSSDTVAAIMAAHGAVPFQAALLVGDLSYADGTQSVWDEWGRLVEPLASTIPMLTAVGNHEWFDSRNDHSFRAFVARTHNPAHGPDGNRTFFSIDLGLIHLVVLSGYCSEMTTYNAPQQPLPCFAPGSPQLTWLRADLGSVDRTRPPWVVASVHQPCVHTTPLRCLPWSATSGAQPPPPTSFFERPPPPSSLPADGPTATTRTALQRKGFPLKRPSRTRCTKATSTSS